MIKFYVDGESKLSECKVESTVETIAAELLAIIDYVYYQIKEANSGAGYEFKKLILRFINTCFNNDGEHEEKKLEEMRKELGECLKELDECLKELKDEKNEVIN